MPLSQKTIPARENLIAVFESASKMLSSPHKIISDEKSLLTCVIRPSYLRSY